MLHEAGGIETPGCCERFLRISLRPVSIPISRSASSVFRRFCGPQSLPVQQARLLQVMSSPVTDPGCFPEMLLLPETSL